MTRENGNPGAQVGSTRELHETPANMDQRAQLVPKPSGATAPCLTDGAGDRLVACSRCGAQNEPGADRCARCQSFIDGNQAAVTAGLYRRQQPIDVVAEAEAFVGAIVADKGGEGELSAIQRRYARELGHLSTILRLLVADIAEQGLLSKNHAPRKVLAAYLDALDRFDRLAQRIGLKREARQLRSNLAAFVGANDVR